MQVVRIPGQLVFTRLSKHSHVMSFEACDCWIPCYLGSTLSQTFLCLQTQILFWNFRHQTCGSCMSFIHSVQRMFVWGINIPYVHNTPSLSLAYTVIWAANECHLTAVITGDSVYLVHCPHPLSLFEPMKENCIKKWQTDEAGGSAAVHSKAPKP